MASLSVATGRINRLLDISKKVRQARLPWIPIIIMGVLLICAGFAPLLSPHDPVGINILDAKLAPGENSIYPLGTDILGRDMLSRLIYGARTAVFISLVALSTGAFVGTVLGLIAGVRAGWPDVYLEAPSGALEAPRIAATILGS